MEKKNHIEYRNKIISLKLIDSYKIFNNNLLPDTRKIENMIKNIGLNNVINDNTISKIRNDLLYMLPKSNINTNKLIAIHFRIGEIINMKDRYIHSKKL